MADKNIYANRLRDHATGAGCARLLAVDRRPVVRAGLKIRPAPEDGLEVEGGAADATGATPLARALRPDVVPMDVGMPGGIATTEALRASALRGAVVVPTLRGDSATRERAKEAGAAAFVVRHRTEGSLLATIRGVALAKGNWRLREGAVTRRVRIVAPSIERVMEMAGAGKPGRRARLLFSIDSEAFFVPEESERRVAA
jgi:DNA-binding NarL/FixJ family response regulator